MVCYHTKETLRSKLCVINNYAKPGSFFSKYLEFLPNFFLET